VPILIGRNAELAVQQEDKVLVVVRRAAESRLRNATPLSVSVPHFLDSLARLELAGPEPGKRHVISHGNLGDNNALWDTVGNPAIIEWEVARRLTPTGEISVEAMDWSDLG
jgi:hypothetical protein